MRITLDRALFEPQSDEEATSLLDLLTTAIRNPKRHALLTDPLFEVGEPNGETDTWLSSRSAREVSAFANLLTTGILTAASTGSTRKSGPSVSPAVVPTRPRIWHLAGALDLRVSRLPESDWKRRLLTIEDAAHLLREPVHLVLENVRTDLAFLKHLIGPTHTSMLDQLLDGPGNIQSHGGGAGEAKAWIEGLCSGPKTSQKWRQVLRTWVLFDQDAADMDARHPSKHALDLLKACEAVESEFATGLSWVCLRRREIESYVPDRGLREESRAAHEAFVQRVIAWRADVARSDHAWALDLKRGLRGDLLPALPTDVRERLKNGSLPLSASMLRPPFNQLLDADVGVLDRGMGERLGEALRRTPAPSWTAFIPEEYERGPADQAPRVDVVQSLFDRM